MNKFFALLCLAVSTACAEEIYVAQTTQGSDTGLDAANAHSKVWFETPANWGAGAGKVSPGDRVHLCGTFSTGLAPQTSGTAGNLITLLFEPNAKFSSANGDGLYLAGLSYMVIDGGTNGIIENTANGTILANQTAGVKGLNVSGCSNMTIKNLTVRNLYVHNGLADGGLDFTSGGGVYANGFGPNMVIQDCSFSDICWCIIMFGNVGGTLTVQRCSFLNYDHGIGGVGGTNGNSVAGFVADSNHFGSTVVWDTTANSYHHDGIHVFWAPGGSLNGGSIKNNLFDGDWGTAHNTAYVFMELNYNTHDPTEALNWIVANNVCIEQSGTHMTNRMLTIISQGAIICNNTMLGDSFDAEEAISITGTGITFSNNLITGVDRYVNAASAFTGNNNIYASPGPGGNTPFVLGASNISTFAAWKTATGQDSASSFGSSVAVNTDGTLPIGSAAIDAGITIAGSIATDKIGTARPQGSAWDVGAYEFTSGGAAPAITSSLTSTGTVGSVYSYTITASNTPTSYNATGLPSGLGVSTSTGVISGTPTAAGVSSVSLSAINGTGTGTATLTLTINASGGNPSVRAARKSAIAPSGISAF